MPPSNYLQSGDYSAYGLPAATTAAQTQQASALLDMALGRPEGLVWTPDTSGAPAYMSALTPSMSYTISGSISPGSNVTAVLSPPILTLDMIGQVLVLDRADSTKVEAARIISVSGNNTVIFASVINAHANGVGGRF